jgi:hypothetical protein
LSVPPDGARSRPEEDHAMKPLLRILHHLQDRPLLAVAGLAVLALAVNSAGALDQPVLAYLGNNPGNQGRN